jgi:hypothetical protein
MDEQDRRHCGGHRPDERAERVGDVRGMAVFEADDGDRVAAAPDGRDLVAQQPDGGVAGDGRGDGTGARVAVVVPEDRDDAVAGGEAPELRNPGVEIAVPGVDDVARDADARASVRRFAMGPRWRSLKCAIV